jgi:YgiT-type zinc finger domain-containing protein
MTSFNLCPVCRGELIKREVQKLLRGGNNTAVVKVQAEICLNCGERLYSQETVRRFESIKAKLAHQETEDFVPIEQSFQVS